MAVNLLAICKQPAGLLVKRVKVSAEVQSQLEGVFIQQEQSFLEGVSEEVAFDGGWNPEPNELLYVSLTTEAAAVLAAAQGNVVALSEVNAPAFAQENIRALAVLIQHEAGPRLLLQEFSARQSLERRFSLVLDGDTFNRLTKPAFSIGASLAGIIEGGKLKFRRFSRVKLIFDLTNLYQEATMAELDTFCVQDCLHIEDAEGFKNTADQKMKKLVHAIGERKTLENYTPSQIAVAAEGEGFEVEVVEDKLVVPKAKADAKALLHFLDNGLYRAALSGEIFITNSKRLLKAAS